MSATQNDYERRIGELQHDLINKDQIILLQIESMKKQRERINALEARLNLFTATPERVGKPAEA